MLGRLLASLQPTITVRPASDRFTFASARREATVGTAVRVAPDGRILGFGDAAAARDAQVLRPFAPDGTAVDERALQAICRRGLATVLGLLAFRPRVIVRDAGRVPVPREALARALRAAGAATVEFAD